MFAKTASTSTANNSTYSYLSLVGPYLRGRVAGEDDVDAEPLALRDALQVGNGGQEEATLDAEAARVEAHRDRVVPQRRGHHAACAVLLRAKATDK